MFQQIIVFACVFHWSWTVLQVPDPLENHHDCDNKILCYGELLETVQLSGVNDNSEQFVNMKMNDSPDNIMTKFELLKKTEPYLRDKNNELKNFINENFADDNLHPSKLADSEKISDEINQPNFITDKTYRQFYQSINPTWTNLAVKTNERVDPEENSNRYSMLPLPHYFIKTGDSQSFPELWQNYLIVRGLLWNKMFISAKNIILNLANLLATRNSIPLTNRIYAEKRHQLPLLSFMVEDYLQAYLVAENKLDVDFRVEMLPLIEKEFTYWTENAGAEIKKLDGTYYSLYKYKTNGREPRPEKYKEDYNLANNLPSNEEKIRFYSAVRALDKTAFGYSSRFLQNREYPEVRSNLEVDRLVPVELNSVLQRCSSILSHWYDQSGKPELRDQYLKISNDIQYGIDEILWSKEHKIWLDLDTQTGQHVNSFYVTNLIPLFTLSYDKEKKDLVPNVINYLIKEKIIAADKSSFKFNYFAIPTSNNYEFREIADKPYGSVFWNILIIDGLRQTEHKEAETIAQNIAAALVKTVYNEHETHGTLFENYRIDGRIKEDEVQKLNKESASTLGGFITLLRWYGEELKYAADDTPTEIGAKSDENMSSAINESDMSISINEPDVLDGKRKITSPARSEDNSESTTKRKKTEEDIS